MGLQLDLKKSAGALQLSLQKLGIMTPPGVDCAFALDVSRSYDDEHRDGSTTMLMQRLVPWGLVFDPDKKLDVYTFSSGREHAHRVGHVDGSNHEDYVRKNVIGKVPGYNHGTDYAHVLQLILEDFGWEQATARTQQPAQKSGGFFGMGKKSSQPAAAPLVKQRPLLVLFNTDGANSDQSQTRALFKQMQDKGHKVYVQFIGVSNQGTSEFRFIQQLADEFANCGLTTVADIKRWAMKSDDDLNADLIGEELVTWLKAA